MGLSKESVLDINEVLDARQAALSDMEGYFEDIDIQPEPGQVHQDLGQIAVPKPEVLATVINLPVKRRLSVGHPPIRDEDLLPADAPDWMDRSNCLGVDPDLFFPERGASTREAKEVCRGCIARAACLEYALTNGEKFGIWGGLSERERRRIRRQRNIEAQRDKSES